LSFMPNAKNHSLPATAALTSAKSRKMVDAQTAPARLTGLRVPE
jgi:hypothetical protein